MSAPIIQNFIQSYSTASVRAVVFGAALGYAVKNSFWHHIPLIVLNPVAYSSYQVFVSREEVADWCKTLIQ